jgi:hypothetical protein
MLRKIAFVAIALFSATVGAHSLNLRELYHEMYPPEPAKQDAFHICSEADPAFIRAFGSHREACYNSMPHMMAVAMGRVPVPAPLTMQAMIDPAGQAALLIKLASMPPQQPVTEPRSFANTAWLRPLSAPCDNPRLAGANLVPGGGRAAMLDTRARNNLPPVARTAQTGNAAVAPLPVIPLTGTSPVNGDKGAVPSFAPLPAPDVGDKTAPVIVPLAQTTGCGA